MFFRLTKEFIFPNPRNGEPDGLLAVGGDLSMERLILAYNHGIFPWYSFKMRKDILWYCPMKRFIIRPQNIHISHSMRSLINSGKYKVSFNKAFSKVIKQCSELRINQAGAWLGQDMIDAYQKLYENKHAMSVEVWQEDKLVGGLYGVVVGKNFCGESMFSLVPSASKLALISLALSMQEAGECLIDCQFETPHLKSMGGEHITYEEYIRILHS